LVAALGFLSLSFDVSFELSFVVAFLLVSFLAGWAGYSVLADFLEVTLVL
jgi:hypothetical protein